MSPAACAAKALAALLAVSAWAASPPLPGGLTGTGPKGWVLALSEPDQAVWTRPAPGKGYAPIISVERRDGGPREAAAFERRRLAGAKAQQTVVAGLAGRRLRVVEQADSGGEHGAGRGKVAVTTEIIVLARGSDFLTVAFSAPSAEFAGRRPDFDAFVSGLSAR